MVKSMTNAIVILGSSRSFGETRKIVETIIDGSDIPIIDLKSLKISPYDYEYQNQNDDYIPLMEKIIQYDLIILATPVYWYTMSATMKIFIDRLSDLLDIRKNTGRQLRAKKLFVIASFNTSLPKGFEDPFVQTCDYMGMHYQGCSFICSSDNPTFKKSNQTEIAKAKNHIFLNKKED